MHFLWFYMWYGFFSLQVPIIECFTTTFLHTHSMAKLGRWGWWRSTMRLAWKKIQKTLDTSKRLHRNKNRSTGSVEQRTYINFIPIYCHHWDCRLGPEQVRQAWEYLRGGWNVLVGGRLQLGLRFWFPPDPRRRCCSTFLNLNWWDSLVVCHHRIVLNMAHNEEPAVFWAPPF